MRPEKVQRRDKEEAFTAIGVPAEWVAPIYKAGVYTIDQLAGQTAGKLHQELCGINKKFKLGFKSPLIGDVEQWIAATTTSAAE